MSLLFHTPQKLHERSLLALIMLAHLFICAYNINRYALSYDEAFSWYFFSGNLSTVFTDYSVPNNHILFNAFSRLFQLTGLEPQVAVRLPSVLASVTTLYVLFRFVSALYGTTLALSTSALLINIYSFQQWSFLARGYGMILLFTILYLTCVLQWRMQGKIPRLLLLVSLVGGFVTVPSFLYAMFIPSICVAADLTHKKDWPKLQHFVKWHMLAALGVLVCYSPILFSSHRNMLLNPQQFVAKVEFSQHFFPSLINYLRELAHELFRQPLPVLIIPIIILILILFIPKQKNKFWLSITGLMLLSPVFIILIHRVYPFARSLAHLSLFAALSVAFITGCILSLTQRHINKTLTYIIVASLSITAIFNGIKTPVPDEWEHTFLEGQRRGNWDLAQIRTIGRTNAELEWCVADLLFFACAQENNKQTSPPKIIENNPDTDAFVIHKSELEKFESRLYNYRLVLQGKGNYIYLHHRISAHEMEPTH